MPSIDYPSNPIAGQTATYSNGNVVIFDGSAWRSTSNIWWYYYIFSNI